MLITYIEFTWINTWKLIQSNIFNYSIRNFFLSFFTDEIDVIGYSSNQSDSDDHLSVQSMQSSDSGVIMSASRLTLDMEDMDI